jgi:hypothetical protein
MPEGITLLLPALPALLLSIACILGAGIRFGGGWPRGDDKEGLLFFSIPVGFVFSAMAIGPLWAVSHIYGVIHASNTYLGLTGLTLLIFRPQEVGWHLLYPIRKFLFFPFSALTVISFLMAVPIAIIPLFTPHHYVPPRSGVNIEFKTTFVQESLSNIKKSLVAVQRDITDEQDKIDNAAQQLIATLEAKNKDLQTLEKQYKTLYAEVDYYKNLASLTESQARSVRQMLTRGKYTDYIFGFLIGVMSSAAFHIILKYGERLKQMLGSKK